MTDEEKRAQAIALLEATHTFPVEYAVSVIALNVEVVVAEARTLGWPPARLALAWSLAHPALDVVLAGPRDGPQLDEAIEARAAALPAETLARLDRESAPAVPFPHDEAAAVASVLRDD